LGSTPTEFFCATKAILSSTPALCLSDLSLPTKVSADTSSYGLGAALLQKQSNGQWKPVAYISTSGLHLNWWLTPQEQ